MQSSQTSLALAAMVLLPTRTSPTPQCMLAGIIAHPMQVLPYELRGALLGHYIKVNF